MADRSESSDVTVADSATVGVEYAVDAEPPSLGTGSVVRDGTIIYDDVTAGTELQTGHHALIREHTEFGDNVLVETQAVIDGTTVVDDHTSMQTGVYLPNKTAIGTESFWIPTQHC